MKAARSSPAAGLRSPRMALSALVATGVVLGAVALVFSPSGPAQAAAPSARRSVTPGRTIFYLAIGASESVGVQPTVTRPHGAPLSLIHI